jgi:hypothetical protein
MNHKKPVMAFSEHNDYVNSFLDGLGLFITMVLDRHGTASKVYFTVSTK